MKKDEEEKFDIEEKTPEQLAFERDEREQFADGYSLTDAGNKLRFRGMNQDDLRFNYDCGRWMVWDGKRWIRDGQQQVYKHADTVVRWMYESAARILDKQHRAKYVAWVKQTESRYRTDAMIELSKYLLKARTEDFDQRPLLLNLGNCTFDFDIADYHPHVRDDFNSLLAGVDYDADATCPRWDEFIIEIFQGREDLIEFVQKAVGYSMTGKINERCLFICYGHGKNGKSVFLNTITSMLGEYASSTPIETLMYRWGSGNAIPNDLAALAGPRFITSFESGKRMSFNEGRVKQITGGDLVTARFLHQEFFSYHPRFKLWLSTNHRPRIVGQDRAIWDRIRLIPFVFTVDDIHEDRELTEKLHTELPGIFNWARDGAYKWLEEGLGYCEDVNEATEQYRLDMDVIQAFIDDTCTIEPTYECSFTDVYGCYKHWCEDSGERPSSSRELRSSLINKNIIEEKRTAQKRVVVGLKPT